MDSVFRALWLATQSVNYLHYSLALLYLVDLFINKLKTQFNNLFYRIILNINRIHNSFWRNFPATAKQTPSKVLFVANKKGQPRPFGHRAPKFCKILIIGNSKWVKNHHFVLKKVVLNTGYLWMVAQPVPNPIQQGLT